MRNTLSGSIEHRRSSRIDEECDCQRMPMIVNGCGVTDTMCRIHFGFIQQRSHLLINTSVLQMYTIHKAAKYQRIFDYIVKNVLQILDTSALREQSDYQLNSPIPEYYGCLNNMEVLFELPLHFKQTKATMSSNILLDMFGM